MKRVGKLCLCVAGGLVLNAGLRAADAVSPDHPYAPIVTRNVFDIHPPPPVDLNPQAAAPPVKITLNGITSVSGHSQALYKVAVPPKPGQPAREQCYMLGAGEAQDDIEVTKIDEAAGVVTFNNHGTIQELPLAVANASGPSAPASGGTGTGTGPGPRPGFLPRGFAPGGGNANSGFIRFGQSGGFGGQKPNFNGGNNANNGGMNGSLNGGANSGSGLGVALGGAGNSYSPQYSKQPQNPLSADDQAVLITANHALAVAQGDPTAVIYPPTEQDAEAGVPSNVAPPPSPGGSTSQ